MDLIIEGAEEVEAALKALPEKVQTRFMGRALREGGKVIVAAMTYDAPVKTGALAAGITQQNSGGEVIVGPGKEQYYAVMLEFGTRNRGFLDTLKRAFAKKKKGFKNTGDWRMRPHPFIQKSLAESRDEAVAAAGTSLVEDIEREAFED